MFLIKYIFPLSCQLYYFILFFDYFQNFPVKPLLLQGIGILFLHSFLFNVIPIALIQMIPFSASILAISIFHEVLGLLLPCCSFSFISYTLFANLSQPSKVLPRCSGKLQMFGLRRCEFTYVTTSSEKSRDYSVL